jgi:hypothetical protein
VFLGCDGVAAMRALDADGFRSSGRRPVMTAKRTHIETMVDKDYLAAWDVAERDYTLTIDRVEKKTLTMRGGKTKAVPVLTLRGARKKFVLAARTNRDTIANLYGPYIEEWPGKAITLFMDPKCKSPSGGTCPGIRIRPSVPKGAGEVLPEREVDKEMQAQQDAAFRDGETA